MSGTTFVGSQLMANYDTPDSYQTPSVGPKSDCWLHANTDQEKYAGLNDMLVNRKIRDAEHRAQVTPMYPYLADRPELENWFEIFAIDDVWMYDPANLTSPAGATPV